MTAAGEHTSAASARRELDVLDENLVRIHRSGPEFRGWLSNHAPMAIESLISRGHVDAVEPWLDGYVHRFEERPRPSERITEQNWRDAIGDPRRLGDWPLWFENQLAEHPWTEVLAEWWPRLLPGVAASATHGVIRVGHAVRSLREHGESAARISEFAYALAYWAARWQPVAGATRPQGQLRPSQALDQISAVPDQSGGIRERLSQLDETPGWRAGQAALAAPVDVEAVPMFLQDLIVATVDRYGALGLAEPIMLVHASTAPNAILRTLPSLPKGLWMSSANIAWSTAAAVYASYAPSGPAGRLPNDSDMTIGEAMEEAVASRDTHAIKFADTAIDVAHWSGSMAALQTATQATEWILEELA